MPNRVGAQNTVKYAYFPSISRLAIEVAGVVTVHDTAGQDIQGFAMHPRSGEAVMLSTQQGTVDAASLPTVDVSGALDRAGSQRRGSKIPLFSPEDVTALERARKSDTRETMKLPEQAAASHASGEMSDEEFAAERARLLARI